MATITCHYCFETMYFEIYQEDGLKQEFVLDCEICCHPLQIQAKWVAEINDFNLEVSPGLG